MLAVILSNITFHFVKVSCLFQWKVNEHKQIEICIMNTLLIHIAIVFLLRPAHLHSFTVCHLSFGPIHLSLLYFYFYQCYLSQYRNN